jgi:large subunit ribosomal protein L22
MEAIARSRHLRQSPKKMRFVLDTVRNMNVNDALEKLTFMNKKAAISISKTISSAVANMAHNNETFNADALFIKTAYVDEGPTMKRFRPAAMGRAVPIMKRSSHLTIVISDSKN